MMIEPPAVSNVAHVIQLAVAPVFLLTGVGAMLNVLVHRLARVVDRFRLLDELQPALNDPARNLVLDEMGTLSTRARMIHWAIGLCTTSALLVCILIIALFVGSLIAISLSALIATLFIAATLALVLGLLCFLREVTLARSRIHVVPREVRSGKI